MTAALGKRVARLEKRLGPDPDDSLQFKALSDDQLYIRLLDEGRVPHPLTPPEQHAELIGWIPDIEEKIRRCAASCANPEYAQHWAEIAERWVAANPGAGDFVPPITNHTCQSGTPEEMRWRAEIRTRPDIAALIAEGEHEMTLKHRLTQLEKTREERGPTLQELIAAAGEGRAPSATSGSAFSGGSGRRRGPTTLAELVAKSYETPIQPAGPVAVGERLPATVPTTPKVQPTSPTAPPARTALTVAERIAEEMAWVSAHTRRPDEYHRADYNPY
jgi:hypothetical protein